MAANDDPVLETMSRAACLELLREGVVGRVAVTDAEGPIVLPVNYRIVESGPEVYVAFRTRPGNVLDQAPASAAFEIDGIDVAQRTGWSVLIRGTLHILGDASPLADELDSHPWLTEDRDSWLALEARTITGRRLRTPEREWAFHVDGYL